MAVYHQQPELPFVSVVIPTYMRAEQAELAARSALLNSYPADRFEVIVVDGSSTDGTVERLEGLQREFGSRFRYLIRQPQGPSASRNAGVEAARGEIIAFLDSDCVAAEDWIGNGIRFFEGRPALGMVQGKVVPPPDVPLTTRSRYVVVQSNNGIHEACNLFYRREAFESVRGFSREYYFDPRPEKGGWLHRVLPWVENFEYVLRYTGEDSDLGWRVLDKGWTKEYCETAVVFHEVRTLPPLRWLIDEACYAFVTPRLLRNHPRLRQFLFLRYFLNPAQVGITLMVLAWAGALVVHPAAMLLGCVYVFQRATEPTRFWRGVKRPFRFLVHLPRDMTTFALLLVSSLRYRRLVL